MKQQRMHRLSIAAIVVVALAACVPAVADHDHAMAPNQRATLAAPKSNEPVMSPKDGLKALTGLKGHWGSVRVGKQDLSLEYEVTSRGSVVVETLGRGTAEEMVTVYSVVDNELIATHHCITGNITTMRLNRQRSTPSNLIFDYVNLNNTDLTAKPNELYVSAVVIGIPERTQLARDDASFSYGQVTFEGLTDLGLYTTEVHRSAHH